MNEKTKTPNQNNTPPKPTKPRKTRMVHVSLRVPPEVAEFFKGDPLGPTAAMRDVLVSHVGANSVSSSASLPPSLPPSLPLTLSIDEPS